MDRDHRREADEEIPERIWRMTMVYHDLIYIKYYWESIGQQVHSNFAKELERVDKRLHQLLEMEHGQGGTFRKLEQELKDETRKSDEGNDVSQGRASLRKGR